MQIRHDGETAASDRRAEVVGSPIHRAVWESDVPVELFDSHAVTVPDNVRVVMDRSLQVIRAHGAAGDLYGPDGPVADPVLAELAEAGYWGLPVDRLYGGSGASLAALAPFVAEMSAVDPYVAGLMSVHAFIGPVGALQTFGTKEQRARLLPPMASGARLGAFAVTEPATSSDWNMITTTARPTSDGLLLTGEKLFITNAGLGRTVGLLVRLDGELTFLIVELPRAESDKFHIVSYPLRSPAHAANVGLRFEELAVPADNVLRPPHGNGRVIAYQALNRGRVGVCAFAAGQLRTMAGTLIPWVQHRATFGRPIADRQLVLQRLGTLAGRIVACDALLAWTSQLLDAGYRGELECVTAKVYGADVLQNSAVDILARTHGARSFLDGSLLADQIHDMIAPTVFEGENELLTIGFFGSLLREHARTYLQPLAALRPDGARPASADVRAAVRTAGSYASWFTSQQATRLGRFTRTPTDPDGLTDAAIRHLQQIGLEISRTLRHHGAKAIDQQARALELARRAQLATVMLVVARYADRQPDATVRQAGLCAAAQLHRELTGRRPSDTELRQLVEVGASVGEDRFGPTLNAARPPIQMAEHLPTSPAVPA